MCIELPPFYVGQKVVSLINGFGPHMKTGIVKDEIYTVCDIGKECNCWWVRVNGVYIKEEFMDAPYLCTDCNIILTIDNITEYKLTSKYFVPLEENFQHIEYEKEKELCNYKSSVLKLGV